MTDYTEADALKHLRGLALIAWGAVTQAVADEPDNTAVAGVARLITLLKDMAAEHVDALTIDNDPTVYSTGMITTSSVPLDSDANWYWVWHPDPGHEVNQPRRLVDIPTVDDGVKSVIISAPGVLDVVYRPPCG